MDDLSASSAKAPTVDSASVPVIVMVEEFSGAKGEGLASSADLAS